MGVLFRRFTLLAIALVFVSISQALIVQDKEITLSKCSEEKPGSICLTPGCIHAASSVLQNMDETIDPCDDFYQFACGGFIAQNTIPDDKNFVMSFTIINDQVENQIKLVLEEPVQDNEARPFVLAKNLYNMCVNLESIEKEGLRTIKTILNRLGGWPVLEGTEWKDDEFDWKTALYKLQAEGFSINSLMSTYIGANSKNSSQRMVNIDQAMLEIEREHLVEGFANDVITAYYEYLVDLAKHFGADEDSALEEIKESIKFEIELAKLTLPKEQRRNFTALTNQMTIRELQDRYPNISWLDHLNRLLAVGGVEVNLDEVVDVGVPKYITDLELLLQRTPKRVQANYLISQVVGDSVPYLTKRLKKMELKFKHTYTGTQALKPRWKECVQTVTAGMSLAASALYVRKYFDEDAKKNAAQLVDDLKQTFNNMLEELDWMDENTKAKAIEKARAMKSHISYPQELLDDKKLEEYYARLNFSSTNYLESAINIKKFLDYNSISKLHLPINKTEWIRHSDSTSVNAYYAVTENSILLPAGILQGVFFENQRPHYMNYGAIGFVIGHEITHGFDDVGRQFDKNGQMAEWWGEKTKQLFIEKAQCIIDQFSNFTANDVHMKLNGINTQGENIADIGGLKEAYLAYNKWIERNGEEARLPGLNYTPKQMFWLSTANLWCAKQRKEHLRQQVLSDSHSPPYFRVIGSLINSNYFAQDFNCPLGSNMNPVHKCSLW